MTRPPILCARAMATAVLPTDVGPQRMMGPAMCIDVVASLLIDALHTGRNSSLRSQLHSTSGVGDLLEAEADGFDDLYRGGDAGGDADPLDAREPLTVQLGGGLYGVDGNALLA